MMSRSVRWTASALLLTLTASVAAQVQTQPRTDAQTPGNLGGSAPCEEVLDFENLPEGTVVSSMLTASGAGPVLISGFNPVLAGNTAIIFDSSDPTGGDDDLGTPNEDFGGPGEGVGGELGSPFQNDFPLGNLLIIAEDLVDANNDQLIDDPDDADEVGATMTFDFTAFGAVLVRSITVIDFEPNEPITRLSFFAPGGMPIGQFTLSAPGDNGVSVDAINVTGVAIMVVELNGSGAVDDICFAKDCNGNGIPDAEDIAVGTSFDCNNNDCPDECDIASGFSMDINGNGVPDECDPDCNNNGIPDDLDIAMGTSLDCQPNGIPDECEDDCDNDGIPDDCEPDCDGDGIPDDCEDVPDCNSNGIPDDCDIDTGFSNDCQPNGIPDECEPDCDNDGIPDDCEPDCDGDGIPDDCEDEPDCNNNGIPDDCDIDSGFSNDCQPNGIPDECEPDCDGDGIPDDCDNPLDCAVVRCVYRALNDDCADDSMPGQVGIGGTWVFDQAAGLFAQFPGGTATLTGTIFNMEDPNKSFMLSMDFSGFTRVGGMPPAGSPMKELKDECYSENGGPVDTSTWEYYSNVTGTLTGLLDYTGAVVDLVGIGGAFQLGIGANGKNVQDGASAWYTLSVVQQPASGEMLQNQDADLNVDFGDCP